MIRPLIGLVDYGVGNVASVGQALAQVGCRSFVSADPHQLDRADLLLLPGVGAFHTAMTALRRNRLDSYLRREAKSERPLLGLCLGMQLLAESSTEHCFSEGLGLIPGQVSPIPGGRNHIGWNTVTTPGNDALFRGVDGEFFYFNHSFMMTTDPLYRALETNHGEAIVSAVRRENVVGLQFHPERSQSAGRALLGKIIFGLLS